MTLTPILRSYFHLMHDDKIVCGVCTVDGKFKTGEGDFEAQEQLFEYYKTK